eukprot:6140903-Prymnesium_polylepis.1
MDVGQEGMGFVWPPRQTDADWRVFGWSSIGWAMVRCAPCGAPVNAELVIQRMGLTRDGRTTTMLRVFCCDADAS